MPIPFQASLHPMVFMLLVLLLGTAGPAAAQTQLLVMGGVSFSDDDDQQFGTSNTAIALSLQQSLIEPIDTRLSVIFAGIGDPPCPPPPFTERGWEIRSGTAIQGVFDVAVPIAVGNRLRFEPFVGVGVRGIGEGEIETPSPDAYAMESNVRLLAGLGGSLYVRLAPRLDLLVQGRGTRHFLGTQNLTDANNETVERDLGTVTSASLLFGLAFRL
ncbi:MAG TPA: hypothetical protein VKP65_07510 [Rhodothermales bacterium]|nr:hypothetical protein [Rhodothermales bacterium]